LRLVLVDTSEAGVKGASLDSNSNVREFMIYKMPHIPQDQAYARVAIYRGGQREDLTYQLYSNPNDKMYIYINPQQHRVMYFKDGLTSSNVVLDYTNADIIPSSLYLTPPLQTDDDGSNYVPINYDTSLAGGNIIIPPANWQYA